VEDYDCLRQTAEDYEGLRQTTTDYYYCYYNYHHHHNHHHHHHYNLLLLLSLILLLLCCYFLIYQYNLGINLNSMTYHYGISSTTDHNILWKTTIVDDRQQKTTKDSDKVSWSILALILATYLMLDSNVELVDRP